MFIAEIIVRNDVFLVVHSHYYIRKVNLTDYTVLHTYNYKGTMVLGAMLEQVIGLIKIDIQWIENVGVYH